MGTPGPEYSDRDCLLCYAAGKTPSVISIAVTGIMTGDLHEPWMPGPPNGTFLVHQNAIVKCYWTDLIDGVSLFWRATGVGFGMTIVMQPPGLSAFLQVGDACQKFFENGIDDPANAEWWGGEVQIWTP